MMPLYYRNIIVDNSRVGVDNARVGPEELIDIKKGFFKVPKKAAGKGSRPHPKRMNFRKSSRGGGHFQSKNLCCKIWTFKQGYLTMKLIQRGLFRLCFSTIVLIKIKTRYILKKAVPKAFKKYKVPATCEGFVASLKNLQHNFPKMRGGGGVKGHLELFRKFIRFGRGKLP